MQFLKLLNAVEGVVRGKREVAEYLLAALLAGGHVLLEDVPGVGKTLLALAVAKVTGLKFRRFQFTSDTLPADILGTFIFDVKKNDFVFREGPIFTNVFLADEINRASPKTQSALLEAMAEGKVTVEGQTFELPQPFFVIATQNPLEEWGTFPLPNSQLDRFMVKTSVGYPPEDIEREILRGENPYRKLEYLKPLTNAEMVLKERKEVEKFPVPERGLDFVIATVRETRQHPELSLGVSTRGALHWLAFSKALAYIRGFEFLPVEILKESALLVLPHRVLVKESSLRSAEEVIREITEGVKV
jgi:MoxR-like ATPase